MKNILISILLLGICFMSLSAPVTFAYEAGEGWDTSYSEPVSDATPTPALHAPDHPISMSTPSPQVVTVTETHWYIPDWVETLGAKMDSLWQTLNDLITGKLLRDSINNMIIMLVDDALTPLFGVFAKSYLFTPRVAEIEFVYASWTVLSIVGLVAMFIGILLLGQQIIRGKRELRSLLKVFFICFVAIFFSLTILNFINVAVNWITQIMLQNMLASINIDYQSLTGPEILKAMVIGTDAINDPSMAARTAGEVIADSEGGIVTLLMVVVFEILPLFLVSCLKVLVLILMAIFVSIWITGSAYSGKVEILVGYANIYIRTLLVGFLLSLHWGVFVKAQTDYGSGIGISSQIGITPLILSLLSIVVIVVLLFIFWLKPLYTAATQPITLGGGQFVEQVGKWGKASSLALNKVGKRLGNEQLQQRGLDWSQASNRLEEYGKRMQEAHLSAKSRVASAVSGGITEVLQGVVYTVPDLSPQATGTMSQVMFKPSEYSVQGNSADMKSILTPLGFEGVSQISIPQAHRMVMSRTASMLAQTSKYADSFP